MRPVPNQRSPQNNRGSIIVELAMIIPFMVVLFLTVIDLGLLLREHQLLENAAREGARLSALTENRIDTSEDPATTKSRIQQRVVEYLSNEEITIDLGLSRLGESHPQPLQEPDVNLSAHPAPITQATRKDSKTPMNK